MLMAKFGSLWKRVKSADRIDWFFRALFLAVGALVATIVGVTLFATEPVEPYGPVSYVKTATVKPRVLLIPQHESGLTVELTRTIDCAATDCPSGGIEVRIETYWQNVSDDGTDTGWVIQTTPPEGVEETLIVLTEKNDASEEGDYQKGVLNTDVITFMTGPPPSEIVDSFKDGDSPAVTNWKLVGSVQPTRENGVRTQWATEVFTVRCGEE